MSSKTDILNRIRRQTLEAAALPALDADWITYPDPVSQFADVLKFVGGQAIEVNSSDELSATVQNLPVFSSSAKIVCTMPELPLGNVRLEEIADPHQLSDIDLAILPGGFAVAENGAVWVDDRDLAHRAIYFIAQHVVLVVPRSQLVHNLHQAYQRLNFDSPGYGLFISGPSKTADIEQSLVIGAHGPRSLTVILTATN